MPRQIEVQFGALAPKLSEQVPQLRKEDADDFQESADAVTMLRIRGILSAAETDKARARLTRVIASRAGRVE